MIDVSRDPRWGRIAESCGEDPYLTAEMGKAMVEGFQGDSLNDPTAIAACAKHFVGYGAAESGEIITLPSCPSVCCVTYICLLLKLLQRLGLPHS